MLQLHLSYQQFCCLLRCDLYKRLYGSYCWSCILVPYLVINSLQPIDLFSTMHLSHIPQRTFCNRNVHVCAHFCYKMMYCGTFVKCIMVVMRWRLWMPGLQIKWATVTWLNTLRPRQNGRHFADDTFKCMFLNENVRIAINISLKFVPKGSINNIPSFVQIMACRRPGDAHICVFVYC